MIKNNMQVKIKEKIIEVNKKPNFHPSKCPFSKVNGYTYCTYSEVGKNKEKQLCHIKKNYRNCECWQNSNLNKLKEVKNGNTKTNKLA
jgi:hypothetical protein